MSNNFPNPALSTNNANTNTVDKLNILVDTVTDLKIITNKLSLSENSCDHSIKTQEKKDIFIKSKCNIFSNQLVNIINENKSLKTKVEQLEA